MLHLANAMRRCKMGNNYFLYLGQEVHENIAIVPITDVLMADSPCVDNVPIPEVTTMADVPVPEFPNIADVPNIIPVDTNNHDPTNVAKVPNPAPDISVSVNVPAIGHTVPSQPTSLDETDHSPSAPDHSATWCEDLRKLGEKVFVEAARMFPNRAPKITGMILKLGKNEVERLLGDEFDLWEKIVEAAKVLRDHQNQNK